MEPLRRILAATDFSPDGACAVCRATSIAAEHGAELALTHIIDASTLGALKAVFRELPAIEQTLLANTERELDLFVRRAEQAHVPASATVRVGAVVDELLAASRAADLLVLGAHGVNSLRDRILGTTAERLLGKCRVPIIVARNERKGPYRRVLAPVDLSVGSAPALAAARRVAPQAELHVFHAYDVPFEGKLWLAGVAEAYIEQHRSDARTQALHDLGTLTDIHLPEDARTIVTVEQGEPSSCILQAAVSYGADLIVTGKHGRSAAEDLILGSVTRHVLANAECDVMVLPHLVIAQH